MKKYLFLLLLVPVIAFGVLWFSIDINPDRVTTIFGSPARYDTEGRLFHVRLSPDSESDSDSA